MRSLNNEDISACCSIAFLPASPLFLAKWPTNEIEASIYLVSSQTQALFTTTTCTNSLSPHAPREQKAASMQLHTLLGRP